MNRNGKAAVFLDRDGTIIEDRGHLRDSSDAVFLPGAFEALQKLQDYFLLFIVTNQTGVAEGTITLADVNRVNRSVVAALTERRIAVADVYVCPHRRADDCSCIKPKPYFIRRASDTVIASGMAEAAETIMSRRCGRDTNEREKIHER